MAEFNLLFAETIPCADDEQAEWLLAALAGQFLDEDEDPQKPETHRDGNDIVAFSDDNFDPEFLVDVVCQFQEKFDIAEPWSTTWAATCSKPRPGEFGGGGVVCHQGKAYWFDAYQWCAREKHRLQKDVRVTTLNLVIYDKGERAHSYRVENTCTPESLRYYLRAGVKAFLKTKKGKRIAQENGGDFNWGDAVTEIPDEYWKRFGILSIEPSAPIEITLDHDENLWREK